MKNHLTIAQASKICGYERSYFYKIIAKYNISIKKNSTGKSYIDPSELCRALPAEMINNELLQETTQSHNTITQETTPQNNDNTEVVELLKKQVTFLEEQLKISQSQVTNLLDTVNKQTLLLENKQQQSHNTITQETTQSPNTVFNDIFKKLRQMEQDEKNKS